MVSRNSGSFSLSTGRPRFQVAGRSPPCAARVRANVLPYRYGDGAELLSGAKVQKGANVNLRPWDVAIVAEN